MKQVTQMQLRRKTLAILIPYTKLRSARRSHADACRSRSFNSLPSPQEMTSTRKICTCKICTCGTHNCPRWPSWKRPDPLKQSVIPFCEGGKIGITEYVDEYVPKPVHPPCPDHPKQFRYAHPRQTTYIHHYPWKCPAEHPYHYKRCPEKSLFKGISIYTSDYTPPPNCPICPVPPFLSQKTTIDKLGHRIYD